MKIIERILWLLFPLLGFIVAFVYNLRGRDEQSQEVLFFSGIGFFFNIILGFILLALWNVF